MNRYVFDVLTLGLVLPFILSLLIGGAVGGEAPTAVESIMSMLTLSPICLIALAVWYGVTQEWRREFSSAAVRLVLRAVKATWVLIAPGLLVGARRLPPPAALALAGGVATYVLLRSRAQRNTRHV